MKICKTCKQEKPETEFRKKKGHGTFYTEGLCIACSTAKRKAYNDRTKEERAIWAKGYYEENRTEIRKKAKKKNTAINEWARNRRKDPKKREAINAKKREWYYKNRDKCAAASKQYKQDNRAKVNTHARLEKAVKDGRITKPERCQGCGEKLPLEGHHQEHSAWDQVIWLCKMCHAGVHMKIRDKKNNPIDTAPQ